MNQGLIPQRYARALYKVAEERGCTEQLYVMMKTLTASFADNIELARTVENPFVSTQEKTVLLLTATGIDPKANATADKAAVTFDDFVKLLARNRRMEFAQGAALAYLAIYRKEHHISTVTVTSAAPLSPDSSERLSRLIKSHAGEEGTVEYKEQVDPSLIGGFTVAIDNRRLDASVKNELKQLRLKLLSH